jgi:hypothetical protein
MHSGSPARLETGCFAISLDTELAWGTNAHGQFHRFTGRFARTRETIGKILQMFEAHRISGTWAIVGHLFLSECRREGPYPHPDVLVPKVRGMEHWHMHDPASTLAEAPFWYGQDIVDAIRRCLQPQEIGCHTFTHVKADRRCNREVFRSQVGKCVEIAKAQGLALRSFVHPENYITHVEALAELGFTCYRGRPRTWSDRLPSLLRRLVRLVDLALPLAPPTYPLPQGDPPLNVPGSMLLVSRDGARRLLPRECRWRKAEAGLRRAVERQEIFHLWLHPWNLAGDRELLACLERIIAQVDRLREVGDLTVMTMGEVADLALGVATQEPRKAA